MIIRDCNDIQLLKGEENPVLMQKFFCHMIRHIFTISLVEVGVNIKVVQHTVLDITRNVYITVTKELKQKEFAYFQEKMKQ